MFHSVTHSQAAVKFHLTQHYFQFIGLLDAAKLNQLDKMKKLLTRYNVDTYDEKGDTPLMFASCNGNQEMCKALLEKEVSVDKENHDGWTALLYAAWKGHIEVCSMLLSCCVDGYVNQQLEDGTFPLLLAAQNDHAHVCTLLLEMNANVNQQTNTGSSSLHIAAEKGYAHICAILLSNKAHVNRRMKDGATPLWTAAHYGHIDVCTLLLENKVHVNEKFDYFVTPTFRPAHEGDYLCTQFLEDLDIVNVNQPSNTGASPLFIASQKGHIHVCTLLLQNNANVNQPMEDGASALFIAAQEGHVHVCTLLLKNNAQVDQKNNAGVSPLLIAAQKGHFQICTLLLENNAHVNQKMEDGTSPLFIAAQEGHFHICRLLLESNAHVNEQSKNGSSPLMIASLFGHVKLCQYLLQNKAVVNLKNNNGQNDLFYAVRKRKYDICKLLIQHAIDLNVVANDGKSILETANATDDVTVISLINGHQNIKTANKEIEETRKHLKKLQFKQIIDRKRQTLEEMKKGKARLVELKKWVLEKQEKRCNLEAQVEFLVEDTNSRIKRLGELTTEHNEIKLLLEQQNSECQVTINNMLEKISDINEIVNKHTTEIRAIESRNTDYERQKREYEFYEKCFQEGNFNVIIKDLNKECPICFEEMLPPKKIFQCSQGHLLCDICFKKVSESTKVCPFCKRDVVTTPIRNRALEEAIENEARNDIRTLSRN